VAGGAKRVACGQIRGSPDSGNQFMNDERLRIQPNRALSFQKATPPILILLLRDRRGLEMRGCMSGWIRLN
jgi:hypothetical protein